MSKKITMNLNNLERMLQMYEVTGSSSILKNINHTFRWGFFLVDDIGLDTINVALRRAVARGAHPRRIFIRSSPMPQK